MEISTSDGVVSAVLFSSLLINILTLKTLYKQKQQEKMAFMYPCVSISIMDMLQVIFGCITEYLAYGLKFPALFQVPAFLMTFTSCSAIGHLTIISILRIVAVKFPSLASQITKRYLIIIAASTITALIITILPLFGWCKYIQEGHSGLLDWKDRSSTSRAYIKLLSVLFYIIPVATLFTVLVLAKRTAGQNLECCRKTYREQNMVIKRVANDKNLASAHSTITLLVYLIQWSPYLICGFLTFTGVELPNWLLHISVYCAKSSALSNGLIYGFRLKYKSFKRGVLGSRNRPSSNLGDSSTTSDLETRRSNTTNSCSDEEIDDEVKFKTRASSIADRVFAVFSASL